MCASRSTLVNNWGLNKKSGWNVLLCSTFQPLFIVWEQCLGYGYTLHHFVSVMLAPIPESRWAYFGLCIIWSTDMAIAFKPTCSLNAFALQYVNSQCQHDSLFLKLAAKLHILAETAKFLTDYFNSCISYILRIYFFQIELWDFNNVPSKCVWFLCLHKTYAW